jgi:hypothetical protein
MIRLSRSDRTLLNAAIRDLRNAPKVLGHGRADSLRSAPFSAHYRAVCPRCRKRIDVGDDIRYTTISQTRGGGNSEQMDRHSKGKPHEH